MIIIGITFIKIQTFKMACFVITFSSIGFIDT